MHFYCNHDRFSFRVSAGVLSRADCPLRVAKTLALVGTRSTSAVTIAAAGTRSTPSRLCARASRRAYPPTRCPRTGARSGRGRRGAGCRVAEATPPEGVLPCPGRCSLAPAALRLEDGHVAADLTQAPRAMTRSPPVRPGRGGLQLRMRMTHTLMAPGEPGRTIHCLCDLLRPTARSGGTGSGGRGSGKELQGHSRPARRTDCPRTRERTSIQRRSVAADRQPSACLDARPWAVVRHHGAPSAPCSPGRSAALELLTK